MALVVAGLAVVPIVAVPIVAVAQETGVPAAAESDAKSWWTYPVDAERRSEVKTALRSLAFHPVEETADGVRLRGDAAEARRADFVLGAMTGETSEIRVFWPGSERGRPLSAPEPEIAGEAAATADLALSGPREELIRAIEEAFNVRLELAPGLSETSTGRLALEGATLFEALEALTVPAGWFWSPLGGRRIVVAENDPLQRAEYEPIGILALPLERADPRVVRRLWSDLGVRSTAFGTAPPVVLAMDVPHRLALARFVVEALEGDGAPGGQRLWLGTGSRPRLADLQISLMHGSVPRARRRKLAAMEPPALAPGPVGEGGDDGVSATDRPRRPPSVRRVLEHDLGLHVGRERCHWPRALGTMTIQGPIEGDRTAVLDRIAEEHPLLWTAHGPNTVLLAPDLPYPRRVSRHRGIAAIPLDGVEDAAPILERAAELELETTTAVGSPRRVLFAIGAWEDLNELIVHGEGSRSSAAESSR